MNKSCSQLSIESSEQLFATSPVVHYWYLLEFNEQWEEDAFNNSRLSKDIKKKITELTSHKPYSRLQLIKKTKRDRNNLKLFIAITKENQKELYSIDIADYEEILNLNPYNLFDSANQQTQQIILVCTHNSYDKCCGKYGKEVYKYLSIKEKDFDIWQTTHLGGHRFAANILMLPEGLYFGRVNSESFIHIKNEYSNNKIYLDSLRGKCYYKKEIQASEYYLRSKLEFYGLNNIKLVSSFNKNSNITVTVFENTLDQKQYTIVLEKNQRALENFASCKDKNKKFLPQFNLLEITYN